MRPLRSRRAAGLSLDCGVVGHALLVHPKGEPDRQSLLLAGGLARDTQHVLVVVDLPRGFGHEGWELVAGVLEGLGASFRLVFARGTREEIHAAGQWFAYRLGCTVVVPDGEPVQGAGGALFIPDDHGAGWLYYRPGRPPQLDSRRFPKPMWEFSTQDRSWATSPVGVVEPLPGGLWVHSIGVGAENAAHVRRQLAALPSDPNVLSVVLGSPADPPLALTDVARWWETVLPSARPLVRFIPFGPVTVPNGTALGQGLANALNQQVALYAGMPLTVRVGSDAPEVVALREDGTPGWRPFASELVYFPGDGGKPLPPTLYGLRRPMDGMPEISAGVYEYAYDAVLEVVQSGLWMRPQTEPPNGDEVRATAASSGRAAILFDRSSPETAERMRLLAEEVLGRLDPATRVWFRLAPADEPEATVAISGRRASAASAKTEAAGTAWTGWLETYEGAGGLVAGGSVAGGEARADSPTLVLPPPSATESAPSADPAIQSATRATPAAVPWTAASPSAVPTATVGGPPAAPAATDAAGSDGSGSDGAVRTAAELAGSGSQPPSIPAPALVPPVEVPVPVEVPASANGPAPVGAPRTLDPVPVVPVPVVDAPEAPSAGPAAGASGPGAAVRRTGDPEPLAAGPGAGPAALPVAEPLHPGSAPTGPGAVGEPTAQRLPRAPAPRVRLESGPVPGPVAPQPDPPSTPDADTDLPPAADPAPVPGPAEPAAAEEAAAVPPHAVAAAQPRVQPVPRPAACVVPPQQGISHERDWVRRNLNEQYNAIAGTVSRVISEAPGLRGASREATADTLTDLVALHLYLSGESRRLDRAVRKAEVGAHVPVARCVASGLARLPSYRGTAVLHAALHAAERDWYEEDKVVTEWAFCRALTTAYPDTPGDTRFLLWSMTARRTHLVDPSVPDRVLFLPGTGFKVLRVHPGSRHTVLLRELSPSEIGEDGMVDDQRVPLDEIALTGLEQIRDRWDSLAGDGPPVVPAYAAELASPPGLITTDGGPAPRYTAGAATPREGA